MRARSIELARFPRSRIAALFFGKKFLQMRSRAALVAEILDFATEISVLVMKIFS